MRVRLDPYNPSVAEYHDLSLAATYRVIGIEGDDLRLLNSEGHPFLYPPELFIVVDDSVPPTWDVKYGEDEERYAYPRELSAPGFFEDYFDGKPEAIEAFNCYLDQMHEA